MITSTKNDQVKAVIELKKKARARAMYKRLGYREADIVPCEFNRIPGVQLVLLEKRL